jgi:hypothetical protein
LHVTDYIRSCSNRYYSPIVEHNELNAVLGFGAIARTNDFDYYRVIAKVIHLNSQGDANIKVRTLASYFFVCRGRLANDAPRNDKRMVSWHNYYQVEWHSGKPKISPHTFPAQLTSENFLINDLSFHNPMSPPEDIEKQKRFKVGRACYTCRQKKIKVMSTRILQD